MYYSKLFNKVLTLYFDLDRNYLTDELGYVIYNPFQYITPNDLLSFKNGGKPVDYIPSQRDKKELIELVFV